MIERRENLIESYRGAFSRHQLHEITAPDSAVRAFYLRAPETRMGSVLLTFSPEGITITGDNPPTDPGTVSRQRKDLDWFAGQLSGDYLCSKFLEYGYEPGAMIASLRDMAEEAKANPGSVRAEPRLLLLLADEIETDPRMAREEVYSRIDSMGVDDPYEYGRGYEPNAAAKLIVIHEVFRRLWLARDGGVR
jgi:hypothetical protein